MNDRAPGEVLVVCTANHCRSPMIEAMLQDAVAARSAGNWVVRSAGTRAVDGVPMDQLALAVLRDRGVGDASFRSRRLTADMVGAADLILTAEAAHRTAVVALRPDAVNRTFTLLQFARLLDAAGEHTGDGDLHRLVATARRARSHSQPVDDDLADPIAQPRATFERTADQIASAVASLVAGHSARRGGAPPPTIPAT